MPNTFSNAQDFPSKGVETSEEQVDGKILYSSKWL